MKCCIARTLAVAIGDHVRVIDWGVGSYERTAAELAPVAEAVVDRAGPGAGDDVLDVACGTGNAALLAAARGARVLGVDAAPRLLSVARERARTLGVSASFVEGDLGALPVDSASVDLAISVFGVIFAADPAAALGELARVLRPGGRALVTAWVPAGPIDAMLGAVGRIVGRVTGQPAPQRFPWSRGEAVAEAAGAGGLRLVQTTPAELAIRAESVEAYVDGGAEHPMAVAQRPLLERAGVAGEVRSAMVGVLAQANEDPDGFLVHSPYVIHELAPD